VKVPLLTDGLRAVKTFKKEGIRTNVTLCFSANQAMLAAKAGAAYISPFIGRLDDTSQDGIDLIEQILTIYRNYDYETEGAHGERSQPAPRHAGRDPRLALRDRTDERHPPAGQTSAHLRGPGEVP
jgi:TalC/MipB family fructose-6-phosphate aldolase